MGTFVNTGFTFNGINSDTMNVMNVRVEDGLIKQSFGTNRTTLKDKTISKSFVSFGDDYDILSFEITLAKLDESAFSEQNLKDLNSWLYQDDGYYPFTTPDYPDLIFYAKLVEIGEYNQNGLGQGYIGTLKFECDSPFGFGQEANTSISDGGSVVINDTSNVPIKYYYPKMEFTATNSTVTIANSTTGDNLSFSGLNVGETISIDNQLGIIISDTNLYRYDKLTSKNWIKFQKGNNNLSLSGAYGTIKYQFPMMV